MRLLAPCALAFTVAAIAPQPAPLPARSAQVYPAIPAHTALGFANARLPWRFAFPRDHAAHFAFQTEWWYYTGHLRARDGRRFGYELTFFRYGLRPGDTQPQPGESRWRGNQVFPVHLALTDERGRRFAYDERFAREALGMGHASDRALEVVADDWTLRGSETFRMRAASSAFALDLVQRSRKPPAVHGFAGVSLKGPCPTCASHYYSMTRLATSGTLTYDGERLRVEGQSWMDHEFGSGQLERDEPGWDWFSIQLDDGRELMDYRLRRDDGTLTRESSGSLIARNGSVHHLALTDMVVAALGTWKSPHTAAVYPSGWRVRVPSARLDLTLTPVLRDQELADTAGGISYWEGAVDVADSVTQKRLGEGYVELTGY
ncbi:MAG: carotenoid 1,2-hydratase, partial [Candidatus Eremiobacteraeota bacterium]|nr:carotenoid 1,2-hydratase [Candidatus Eremiobacteraeota bacterium]